MAHTVRHVRRNWKKYTFGTLGLLLGSSYSAKRFRETLVIREYCLRAKKYGEELVSGEGTKFTKKVMVFLNPTANKRDAKIQFLKYAAPLLHLSGMDVTVVESEYEGQIRTLLGYIHPETDAIIAAGGDGTLLEVVNGLMRRHDAETSRTIPIGVIPLGKENTFYRQRLAPSKAHTSPARSIGEATMNIIEGTAVPMHLMEIQPESGRMLYALSSLEWGVFKDAYNNRNSFRLFGKLRVFFSYLNTALRRWPSDCTLHVWLPPSTAAAATAEEDCAKPPGEAPLLLKPWRGREENLEKAPSSSSSDVYGHRSNRGFFTRERLLPGFIHVQCISKTPVPNLRPERKTEAEPSVNVHDSDQFCVTSLVQRLQGADSQWKHGQLGVVGFKVCPKQYPRCADYGLSLLVWPSTTEKGRFIKQGWAAGLGREPRAPLPRFSSLSRELILQPHGRQPSWVSIDGEPYEARPVAMTLLPNVVRMYTGRRSQGEDTAL